MLVARPRRFTSPRPSRAGLVVGSARFYVGGAEMNKSEVLEFHEREAARYRRLLASVTTPLLKARLAGQAEEHERLAKELSDEQVLADA
jgi:hypothetical protein